MPALKNTKHEAFAQMLVEGQKRGWSRGACYSRAGYTAEGHAADVAASRLMTNAESGIAARVQELLGAGARRAEVTAASVLSKLDDVYSGASQAKQFSAAGRAAEAMAKIAGVGAADRIEVGGPGSFAALTEGDVLAKVKEELGAEAASILSWTLSSLDDASPMPADDIARLTLQAMTLDQALARNEQLREALVRVASDDAVLVQAEEQPRDQVDHVALALLQQPKPMKGRRH